MKISSSCISVLNKKSILYFEGWSCIYMLPVEAFVNGINFFFDHLIFSGSKFKQLCTFRSVDFCSSEVTMIPWSALNNGLDCLIWFDHRSQMLQHKTCKWLQWNPFITDTIGNQNFGRYSEVSQTQGLPVSFWRGMRFEHDVLRFQSFPLLYAGREYYVEASTTSNSANLMSSC